MTQDILNFLTGGVFTTLKDLVINLIQYIITFGMNIVNIFVSPIISKVIGAIPYIEDLNGKINYLFDFITPYINFILDLSFLSTPILYYLVFSIIGRVTVRLSSYLTKVILQWYEKLIP